MQVNTEYESSACAGPGPHSASCDHRAWPHCTEQPLVTRGYLLAALDTELEDSLLAGPLQVELFSS